VLLITDASEFPPVVELQIPKELYDLIARLLVQSELRTVVNLLLAPPAVLTLGAEPQFTV
jgi:hypothetical protein